MWSVLRRYSPTNTNKVLAKQHWSVHLMCYLGITKHRIDIEFAHLLSIHMILCTNPVSCQGYNKKTQNKSAVQYSDFKTHFIYPNTGRNALSSLRIHECAPIPVVGKASLFRHVHPSPKAISVQPMTYWIFPNPRTSMFEDPKMNLYDPRKVRLHCFLCQYNVPSVSKMLPTWIPYTTQSASSSAFHRLKPLCNHRTPPGEISEWIPRFQPK